MHYMGGKTRIAKEILPIILADRKEGQYFVEPFCGGCNVTANVSGNRIANDYNEYLIAMFVGLLSGDYRDLRIPDESIIYCDPPYMGTTGYSDGINHDEFWQWCRERVYDGHKVYISEYQAPDDFICIWEKEIINRLNNKKATEKLFIYEGQF